MPVVYGAKLLGPETAKPPSAVKNPLGVTEKVAEVDVAKGPQTERVPAPPTITFPSVKIALVLRFGELICVRSVLA